MGTPKNRDPKWGSKTRCDSETQKKSSFVDFFFPLPCKMKVMTPRGTSSNHQRDNNNNQSSRAHNKPTRSAGSSPQNHGSRVPTSSPLVVPARNESQTSFPLYLEFLASLEYARI